MRSYQGFADHGGRSQQSLVISTPKYHKRYILPGMYNIFLNSITIRIVYMLLNDHIPHIISVGETMVGANLTKSKYVGCSLDDEEEWPHFRNGISFYSIIFWFHLCKRLLQKILCCIYSVYIPKLFELQLEKHQHLQQQGN